MKTTTEFEEWFRNFDTENTWLLHQMYISVRDGNSYEPFNVCIDGEKLFLSCSENADFQLLISTKEAKRGFFYYLNKFCGGDIELKYAALPH